MHCTSRNVMSFTELQGNVAGSLPRSVVCGFAASALHVRLVRLCPILLLPSLLLLLLLLLLLALRRLLPLAVRVFSPHLVHLHLLLSTMPNRPILSEQLMPPQAPSSTPLHSRICIVHLTSWSTCDKFLRQQCTPTSPLMVSGKPKLPASKDGQPRTVGLVRGCPSHTLVQDQ